MCTCDAGPTLIQHWVSVSVCWGSETMPDVTGEFTGASSSLITHMCRITRRGLYSTFHIV